MKRALYTSFKIACNSNDGFRQWLSSILKTVVKIGVKNIDESFNLFFI